LISPQSTDASALHKNVWTDGGATQLALIKQSPFNSGDKASTGMNPDAIRSRNLLLSLAEMRECTGLNDWHSPVGPVVGTLVEDSNLFETYGGTSACFCDWLSDSANLYVTDLRMTFATDVACKDYHEQALPSNAEIKIARPDGKSVIQMVELETQSGDTAALSLVGSCCHVFCGPTQEARSLLSSVLTKAESSSGSQLMSQRIEKAMHLVYLFRVDRVVCKLCVTAFNGLIPFGYAFALAKGCFTRMNWWQSAVKLEGISTMKTEHKPSLREILKRRAMERLASVHEVTTHQSSVAREEGTSRKPPIYHRESEKELFFKLSLFVAALGKGRLIQGSSICSKSFERLETLCAKVPKDQIIAVDLPASGRTVSEQVNLKLRLFVSRSEDAKAVQGYINAHSKQRPSPFIVLFENLPVAVRYNESLLAGRRDLSPAVADRLRKQAKSRAVRFVRRILGDAVRKLSVRELLGNRGPNALTALLASMLPEHLSALPTGGQKCLLLTSDDEPLLKPVVGAVGQLQSDSKPSVKAEFSKSWLLDDVEGVDGLMALCQSPPASRIADWSQDAQSCMGGLVLRSGRRRRGVPDEWAEGNDEETTRHLSDESFSPETTNGKRQCLV
jgi:hypothetical protein